MIHTLVRCLQVIVQMIIKKNVITVTVFLRDVPITCSKRVLGIIKNTDPLCARRRPRQRVTIQQDDSPG